MGMVENTLRGVVDKIRKPGRRHILTDKDVAKLYQRYDSIVDVLPWADYDQENEVFYIDDDIEACSVGAVFEITAADVDGRPQEYKNSLHSSLSVALSQLPSDDQYPWVLQFFINDTPLDKRLGSAIIDYAENDAKETELTQWWADVMQSHGAQMAKPGGIFYDPRKDGGFRAISRRFIMCLYRRAPAKIWDRDRDSPARTLNQRARSFLGGLRQCGIDLKRLDDHAFRDWFGAWINGLEGERLSEKDPLPDYEDRMPGFDLAEQCLRKDIQPVDNGVMKIGDHYKRFIALGGVSASQTPGILFSDRRIESETIGAIWDSLPSGSMMAWSVVPFSRDYIDKQMSRVRSRSRGGSEDSKLVNDQIDQGRRRMLREERIYSVSIGVYVQASDQRAVESIAIDTESRLNTLPGIKAINSEHDEIPYDGFCRHLPMAWSVSFDLKHLNRARKLYVRDLAAMLPFYGRSVNETHLAHVFFNRSGQLNAVDPIRQKSMSAHALVFGPTGAGKTATLINMIVSNMAIYRPRQYIIGKGNAFRLYGQLCERLGLKVRTIDASYEINQPPFRATKEALKQIENHEQRRDAIDPETSIDDLQRITQTTAGEIARDYLGEMVFLARMMIRGGNVGDAEIKLDQNDIGIIQSALIDALKTSHERDEPHARPQDLVATLMSHSESEPNPRIKDRIRVMAGALRRWTTGMHGHYFNRFAQPQGDDVDVTIVEMGALSAENYKDMLGVTVIGLVNEITSLGERHRYDRRHIEVYADEQHIITKDPLLVAPFLFGVKTWRTLGIWLTQSTQNFEDYTEASKKMLGLAEWWYLINISGSEMEALKAMRTITAEQEILIRQAKKDAQKPPNYTEGVLLSEAPSKIFRVIQPPISLALAQTDTDEQSHRFQLMKDKGYRSELDAAFGIAEEIEAQREKIREALAR